MRNPRSTGDSDRAEFKSPGEITLEAKCPHCERRERFTHRPTAQAWLTGHIHEEHPDELPAFANEDTDRGDGDA